MRYTECRLTPIATLLLSEIEQDTVDFAPNYDGAFKEPKLLPARLPMLLANGASGIGVRSDSHAAPFRKRAGHGRFRAQLRRRVQGAEALAGAPADAARQRRFGHRR